MCDCIVWADYPQLRNVNVIDKMHAKILSALHAYTAGITAVFDVAVAVYCSFSLSYHWLEMGYNLQLNRMTDTVCYQYITVILISDPKTVLLYLIQCFSTFLLKQILPQMYTLQKEP